MYIVTVLFEVAPDMADVFQDAVLTQARLSLEREPACHRFDVGLDPKRPERCFLYEIYDDRAAFDRHLASAHFKSFDQRVAPWVVHKHVETWTLAPAG